MIIHYHDGEEHQPTCKPLLRKHARAELVHSGPILAVSRLAAIFRAAAGDSVTRLAAQFRTQQLAALFGLSSARLYWVVGVCYSSVYFQNVAGAVTSFE